MQIGGMRYIAAFALSPRRACQLHLPARLNRSASLLTHSKDEMSIVPFLKEYVFDADMMRTMGQASTLLAIKLDGAAHHQDA